MALMQPFARPGFSMSCASSWTQPTGWLTTMRPGQNLVVCMGRLFILADLAHPQQAGNWCSTRGRRKAASLLVHLSLPAGISPVTLARLSRPSTASSRRPFAAGCSAAAGAPRRRVAESWWCSLGTAAFVPAGRHSTAGLLVLSLAVANLLLAVFLMNLVTS